MIMCVCVSLLSQPPICCALRPFRNLGQNSAEQLHLNGGVSIERLEALMPKPLGMTWAAALASPDAPLSHACTYARQLESIAVRWQNGDHSMLQPAAAYPHMAIGMVMVELKKEAGRKELELLGQSSAARSAAGGSDWAQKGGEQAT